MLKDIEAVIFDLDGTLIDSMWVWQSIDREYLGKREIAVPKELNKELEGMSFEEVAAYFKEKFGLEDSVEEIVAEWNRMAWDKYEHEVKLKQGVRDFLKYLKSNDIKTGIATSNSRGLAQLVLKANNIDKYIDKIVTSTDVSKGKPEPDVYLLAAKELNKKPCKCLVFEDVLNGMIAGKRANMRVCAVYDKASHATMEQKKEVADYVIDDMTQIAY
ncbi:MAG: HAD family phosphatase [Lachnospiraceae bacterium]|nr:HAD family phosphatase [Lachnospiraceae bacterium]